MALRTKYYDKIRAAQAARPADFEPPPFDRERLRTKSLAGRIAQRFLENPRWALRLLRRFRPNIKIGPFVLVTRAADVREVLERQEDFETPFGLEMAETTGGVSVLLGLQDGSLYRRQKSAVLSAFPPEEAETRVRAIAQHHSRAIMATAQPGFDAVADLLRVVPARICRDYYGLTIDDERAFTDWSIALSTLYFGDHLGDADVRVAALAAAREMTRTIELSIDDALAGRVAPDTPLARLVARHRERPEDLTRIDVRALMFGMVSGFVPTDILASGNALDVILSSDAAQQAVEAAIALKDDPALDRALMEAMRFKPINIGPVRYANRDTTIAGKTGRAYAIAKGTTLWVCTLSAMFDESEIADPEIYNPDRPARDSAMVFGHGIHWCIGSAIARVQIAECLKALFAKGAVRRAPGRAGRLQRLGPFPESLAVAFRRPAGDTLARHALVTIVCPVAGGMALAPIRDAIAALGNPARPDLAAAFRVRDTIHFASVNLACRTDARAEKADDTANLVIEVSGDGSETEVIAAFAEAAESALRPLLAQIADLTPDEKFAAFLRRHAIRVGPGGHAGALFAGTPGHSVQRIRSEAELERQVAGLITAVQAGSALPPMETVRKVREHLAGSSFDWALTPSRSLLEHQPKTWWEASARFRRDPFAIGVATLLVIGCALANYFWLIGPGPGFLRNLWVGTLAVFLAPADIATFLLIVGVGPYLLLRRRERSDPVSADLADLKRFDAIAARENAEIDGRPVMQNHLAAISTMKPGRLRRSLLRVVFAVVAIAAKYVFRPGYLADINTIHFARWVRIPRTGQLMFLSNYGGSWESYLEDFITKAHQGLTGVWSNTIGFPRTRNLFFDGATDGDRFKRWARRQQIPTLFWYTAYPDLNTRRIRANSAIRQGLATVASESAAREWLSLFGSLPRPVGVLETDDIQSIFFGPFGPLPQARFFALSIPETSTFSEREQWLRDLSCRLTYGDGKPTGVATIAAFGPDGLARLGLRGDRDSGALTGFPLAFRQGMDSAPRARLLDDTGPSAPGKWTWGHGGADADAIVVIYADNAGRLEDAAKEFAASSRMAGLRIVQDLALKTEKKTFGRNDDDAVGVEPFGFADGISQPVVEGTPRARHAVPAMHRIAAGEILFGYKDGRGFMPPALTVPTDSDRAGILPEIEGEMPGDRRDFGRNGSFLVVRQLRQDVDGFTGFCARAAERLNAGGGHGVEAEWIGAKMVGRWKDGSSLIRNPQHGPRREVDNDFDYGSEDPQGLHSPLGAHVRRAFPRDSLGSDRATQIALANRHRILRVGRPYHLARKGKTGGERGLLFMCLNADIERQFEFVQQTWIAAGSFHGLRAEKDPLIGNNHGGAFTLPAIGGGAVLHNLNAFVETRGGGYFFMPGRRAIAYLLARLATPGS